MRREAGFTLIELLMAMAIFSAVLLVVAVGFLNIVRLYQSGIALRKTQQNTRYGMEQLVRELRVATRIDASGTSLCFTKGGYFVYYTVSSGNLQRYQGSCSTSGTPTTVSSSDVQVIDFRSELVQTGNSQSVNLVLRIATLSSTLAADHSCQPGSGSQFCSTTVLTSSVSLRSATP